MLWMLLFTTIVATAAEPLTPAEELAITIGKLNVWIFDHADFMAFNLSQFWDMFPNLPPTKDETDDLRNVIRQWISTQQRPRNMEINLSVFPKLDENYLGISLTKYMSLLHELTTKPTAQKYEEFETECRNIKKDVEEQRNENQGFAENSLRFAKENLDRGAVWSASKRYILTYTSNHIRSLLCNNNELFAKGHFTTLINMVIDADKEILKKWNGPKLIKEVQYETVLFEQMQKSLIGNEAEWLATIKNFLEAKYYWLRFNIDIIKPSHIFPNSITVPIHPLKGKKMKLAIRFRTVDDKQLSYDKVAEPVDIPRSNKDERKAAARDQLAKGSSAAVFVGTVADGAEALSRAKSMQEKIEVGFKKFLRSSGALVKTLAPIISSALTLASLYDEEGTTTILDEIRAGFKDMHVRFNALENQIQQMQKELTAEIAFRTQFAAYQTAINDKINLLSIQLDLLADRPMYGPYNEGMIAMCNPNGTNPMPPLHLLGLMKTSYFSNELSPLLAVVKEWADKDRRKLQSALTFFLADAIKLAVLHGRCVEHRYSSGIFVADTLMHHHEMAKVQSALSEIRSKILELDDQAHYDWPDVMEKRVETVLRDSQSEPRKKIQERLTSMLTADFYWNHFQVFVIKGIGSEQALHTKGLLYNPDYARFLQVEDSVAFITWTSKKGTGAKYEKDPTSDGQCFAEVTEADAKLIFEESKHVQAVFVVQGEWFHSSRNLMGCPRVDRLTSLNQAYGADADDRLVKYSKTCKGTGGRCTASLEHYVTYLVNTGQGY